MATSAGATDMKVNGSTTAVDFNIVAATDGDRFIHSIAFTIADAGAAFNEFGNITALTTGCDLEYNDAKVGTVVIGTALKTNFDFVQMCNFEPSFGTGTAAFRATNVAGTSEAYVPVLDTEDVFGLRYGIRIPQNSSIKLILRINDDVTAVDRFDVRCYGFDVVYPSA